MAILLALFWLNLFILEFRVSCHETTEQTRINLSRNLHSRPKTKDNRNVFSPRMDYDEWTPLGRGDPLKNDPTYDYVPPVLERVHYWMDPSKRTPDPPLINPGVLVLGSSRTESPLISSKTPQYTTITKEAADSRLDTSSLLDPFLKFMDVSKFGLNLSPNTVSYYRPTTRKPYTNYYHTYNTKPRNPIPPQALQRPPYTILMPPPPPNEEKPTTEQYSIVFTTTTTQTTVDEQGKTQLATVAPAMSQSVTPGTKLEENVTKTYPTILANNENVYKPVAIVMPENETNQTQNEIQLPEDNSMVLPIISMFSNHKKEIDDLPKNYKQTEELKSTYSPKYEEQGIISESNDIENEAIGEPSDVMIPPPQRLNENPGDYYVKNKQYSSSIKEWNKNKVNNKHSIDKGFRPTTLKPLTTTAHIGLTTDPMFKHYKQPKEPIKGPFYLIIQGHSKVKTYGASKGSINGLTKSLSEESKEEDRNDRMIDQSEDYEDGEDNRRSRKLEYRVWENGQEFEIDDDKVEIVEGHPTFEIEASYKTKPEEVGYVVMESLEDAFGKVEGGKSKKRYLVNDFQNMTDRTKRYLIENPPSRKLLSVEVENAATVDQDSVQDVSVIENAKLNATTVRTKTTTENDDEFNKEIGLESLLALSDDYNAEEEVINALLKDEGQGSGFGGLVSSIFSRSLDTKNNS